LTTVRTCLLDMEIEPMAGVIGRQGMLAPIKHLIPPLICISYKTYEIDVCSLFVPFHVVEYPTKYRSPSQFHLVGS
jgi:hypothetical protein